MGGFRPKGCRSLWEKEAETGVSGWCRGNIVREDDFVCVFCGSDLPAAWKVDPAG